MSLHATKLRVLALSAAAVAVAAVASIILLTRTDDAEGTCGVDDMRSRVADALNRGGRGLTGLADSDGFGITFDGLDVSEAGEVLFDRESSIDQVDAPRFAHAVGAIASGSFVLTVAPGSSPSGPGVIDEQGRAVVGAEIRWEASFSGPKPLVVEGSGKMGVFCDSGKLSRLLLSVGSVRSP